MNRSLLSALLLASSALAELPVTEVTLYKHGVGYFERSGELRAGEAARLSFKASEMNDVLKSLTIEDAGGSKITALRYDSSEPLGKKLQTFPFNIGEQQRLSAVLDQLKGARLELRAGAESIAGIIVGGRTAPGDGKRTEREQVTLLLDSGEIRTFDLDAVSGIRLADPALQAQFKEYLAAIAQSRSNENRSVYIDSTGTQARKINASYMIPAAIWKSSYRLIFGDTGQPTLEGWAIVDNTTGDDWNGVKLALVSGRPISFITQLYEPRYRLRPSGELPDDAAAAPVVHAGVFETAAPEALAGFADARSRRAAGVAGAVSKDAMLPPPAPARMMSSIAAPAQARDLGELFEYRFDLPVSVRQGQSAMLPFLQQKITSRKLLIYSDTGSLHPSSAAELTNSTGKTLDGGPITIYDQSSYAGEALVETLKAGDKRLISYAIDLGTRITTAYDSSRDHVREVKLRRGILLTRAALQETKTYTVRNVDPKAKTLVIEHPIRQGYTLLNVKPAEITATHYRFEVKLASNAAEKFAVNEERVYDTQTSLVNLTPDLLANYVRNKALTENARKQLEQILDHKRQIAQTAKSIQSLETEIQELVADQDRIRQNLGSLNRVAGQQEQVLKYTRDLAAQETRLAALRDSLAEQRRRRTALESELNSMIEKMEF